MAHLRPGVASRTDPTATDVADLAEPTTSIRAATRSLVLTARVAASGGFDPPSGDPGAVHVGSRRPLGPQWLPVVELTAPVVAGPWTFPGWAPYPPRAGCRRYGRDTRGGSSECASRAAAGIALRANGSLQVFVPRDVGWRPGQGTVKPGRKSGKDREKWRSRGDRHQAGRHDSPEPGPPLAGVSVRYSGGCLGVGRRTRSRWSGRSDVPGSNDPWRPATGDG